MWSASRRSLLVLRSGIGAQQLLPDMVSIVPRVYPRSIILLAHSVLDKPHPSRTCCGELQLYQRNTMLFVEYKSEWEMKGLQRHALLWVSVFFSMMLKEWERNNKEVGRLHLHAGSKIMMQWFENHDAVVQEVLISFWLSHRQDNVNCIARIYGSMPWRAGRNLLFDISHASQIWRPLGCNIHIISLDNYVACLKALPSCLVEWSHVQEKECKRSW